MVNPVGREAESTSSSSSSALKGDRLERGGAGNSGESQPKCSRRPYLGKSEWTA